MDLRRGRVVTDADRLDYLEREANREPILLHAIDATQTAYRGIGLKNTGRTLRQAIDQMAGWDRASRKRKG